MIYYKPKKKRVSHFAFFHTDEDEQTAKDPKRQNDENSADPEQEEPDDSNG